MKSLNIIAQGSEKLRFKSLISALRLDLQNGQKLSVCVQRYPHLFDSFTCQLIRIGEKSGTLDRCLERITLYKEKIQMLRKQVLQALIYPALILTTALFTSLVLLLFLVPQFAVLFEHFPNQVPWATQVLIQTSFYLRKGLPGLGLIFLFIVLPFLYFYDSKRLRERSQKMILRLRPFRKLAHQIALAHFSRALALMLAAGLPLTEALLLASQLSPVEELKRAILKLHAGVNAGKPLSSHLVSNPLFPSQLAQMTRIGEESGSLDIMLDKFSAQMEIELEHKLAVLKLLLEPLIIAILGVLIGGIVLAMYLPLFRLGTVLA